MWVYHIWWQRWDLIVVGERRGPTGAELTFHVRDKIESSFQIEYWRCTKDGTGWRRAHHGADTASAPRRSAAPRDRVDRRTQKTRGGGSAQERLEDARRRDEATAQKEEERQEEVRRREEAVAQKEAERQEEIRRREEERREEIRQRDEAAARREDEVREEFRRREEESRRREELMRAQMEMLKDLITGVQEQGEKAALKLERNRDVKVTNLTEQDDIEAYLTTFERLMKAYEIARER